MFRWFRRACARLPGTFLVLLVHAACAPAGAQDDGLVALDLDEAATLSVAAQPLLTGLQAQRRAAAESAIAAAQLPDPRFNAGVAGLPVTTGDAYSLTRDSDTQIQVGVMQDVPRKQKRRLRGELLEREALRLEAAHELARRGIQRDAALAWLELWRVDRERALTRDSLEQARAQLQLAGIALRTGTASQADFLAARQELNRLQDAVSAVEQGLAHARNKLSRWIGDAAFRPVCPDLPQMPGPPALDVVLARVVAHPLLAGAVARLSAARTAVSLADAAYRPDWRFELDYGYRPAYSEMVSVQVGMDLPLFTGRRQDRGLAAALAQQDAAESGVEDARRVLQAEARVNHHDMERLAARLRDYDATLLADGQARVEAALAGWRAGRGAFGEVFQARRARLELQIGALGLQGDLATHFVQLTYLGAYEPVAGAGEISHE